MIEKRDKLNRLVYVNFNEVERVIYKYYGNTNKIKIKIRLVSKEQIVEIYNKEGKIIYSDETNNNFIKMKNIKIYKNKISIKLPNEIRKEYLGIYLSILYKKIKK
jgi:hypothetical protein